MGKAGSAESGLLFIGTLYNNPEFFTRSNAILQKSFGEILFTSPPSAWDYSLYYKEEIGWPIVRQFIFFRDLIDAGNLPAIKLKTNEIEESLSVNNKRSVNLDPGYLTLAKVVLASTKNYSHRIYLGEGIYAEVTLVYQDDTFKPHLFTYRDYQRPDCIGLFVNARTMLKKTLDEK
jgi:hypothetical protein